MYSASAGPANHSHPAAANVPTQTARETGSFYLESPHEDAYSRLQKQPPGPTLFREVIWSPSVNLERPSRWILLMPSSGHGRARVMDLETGQQAWFQAGVSPPHDCPDEAEHLARSEAQWLRHGQCVLFHPSNLDMFAVQPTCIRKADVHSQDICTVTLPGTQSAGNSHLFTIKGPNSSMLEILCWVAEPVTSMALEKHIVVYDLSSLLLLYHLSCPEQLLDPFLNFHNICIRRNHRGPYGSRHFDWKLDVDELH